MKKPILPIAMMLAASLLLGACTVTGEKTTDAATDPATESHATNGATEAPATENNKTEAPTTPAETEPATEPATEPETEPEVFAPDHDYVFKDPLHWSHQVLSNSEATYTLNGNDYTIDLAMEASFDRVIGYCCGWYTVDPAKASSLNVRDKPSSAADGGGTAVTAFSPVDYFLVIGMPETGGGTWARIYYQGKILYLSASYIMPYTGNGEVVDVTVPPDGNEQPANPSIVISAPTGTTSQYVESIKAPDGTDSGVYLYTFNFSGEYGNNKQALVLTGSLANTHLSLKVINCGDYIVSQKPVDAAANAFSSTHAGQTMLGAVNGDLWMTKVHSSATVTSSVLAVTRGVLIINKEIWATQQFGYENYGATNAEQGTTTPPKNALGVTADNQPIVGMPEITVKVTNTTKNTSLNAAGLNRLPATNSVVVYNNRCYTTNYALSDTYEVVIETANSAFTLDGKVTGTVKRICEAGSTDRAALDEKTVIITARGNKIDSVRAAFAVGDQVEFSCSLIDLNGNTDLWYQVTDAIGGHMQTLFNGKTDSVGGDGEYPTTIVGYRDDGTVMLMTVNSTIPGAYKGLPFSKAVAFCKELGFNSAFYLDGGGSATLACMTGDKLIVRNNGSDGSARAVINAIGFVWNDTPVCEKQGDLSYIKVNETANLDPAKLTGEQIGELLDGPCNTVYSVKDGVLTLSAKEDGNDAYVNLSYDNITKKMNADTHKYMVIKYRTTQKSGNSFGMFLCAGSVTGATPTSYKNFAMTSDGEWHTVVIDLSAYGPWNGNLHAIRLDFIDNANVKTGDAVEIESISFYQTADEANAAK